MDTTPKDSTQSQDPLQPALNEKTSWREALKAYTQPKAISLFFLGFSAGLPFMLVFASLSFWLREADISRSTIGFFSWVGLAFGFKWVWAPLIDRLPLPVLSRLLGRRRAWLLLAQFAITLSLVGMAFSNPEQDLWHMALFAVLVAFSSATQDIVIDAYRIEIADERLQAVLAATYMIGYRIAMIVSGAGTLALAAWFAVGEGYEIMAWRQAYLVMAGLVAIGMITTLCIREPEVPARNSELEQKSMQWLDEHAWLPRPLCRIANWFYGAVFCPFIDFVVRYRWQALLILLLISTYRISDIVQGIMANPFYVDMGYTKEEIAFVTKVFGVIVTLLGATMSGTLIMRFGVMRILLAGAILTAATNLLFSWLAVTGHNLPGLIAVIIADNLSAGVATAAFVAYLSGLTSVQYSATQYALFSSVMLLFPKFIAGFSGVTVDAWGYETFFTGCALIGVPVIFLILLSMRYTEVKEPVFDKALNKKEA
ncbi:AmpG family muropeptide MFS transporter [Endozoicomonadaceae bacterium StTr2]